MHRRASRRAFTLVEIVFTFTAFAMLLSLLVPALRQSRVSRAIASDLGDLREHGAGIGRFAADFKDSLPNHPDSPGFADPADQAYYGPRGVISHAFASDKLPVNGWNFPSAGDTTPGIPFLPLNTFTDTGLGSQHIHAASTVLLSGYASEKHSVNSLGEMFLAAGHTHRRQTWRNWNQSFRTGQPASNGVNYAPGGPGTLPPTTNTPPGNTIGFGSYLYVQSGFTTPRVWSFQADGTPFPECQRYFSTNAYISHPPDRFPGPGGPMSVVRRNLTSEVVYPSAKVLFHTLYAFYDAGDYLDRLYFQDGIASTVALADGSARAIIASRDAIQPSWDDDVFDFAGPFYGGIVYDGELHPSYFTGTLGGIWGRDL